MEARHITSGKNNAVFYIVPWDTEIFGFPVAQVKSWSVEDMNHFDELLDSLYHALESESVRVVSAKIDNVEETLPLLNSLLKKGFDFIETTIEPYAKLAQVKEYDKPVPLEKATLEDKEAIKNLAREAFAKDRFHVDSRFPRDKADYRFHYWVENSFKQDELIYVLRGGTGDIQGFFISKEVDKNEVYLSLAGVRKDLQGRGHGFKLYAAMMSHFKSLGYKLASSTISLYNQDVFRLYSGLGFHFRNPRITLHAWFGR